jgi:hypothetical protein
MKSIALFVAMILGSSLSGITLADFNDDFELYSVGAYLPSPWENSNVHALGYGYAGSQGASRYGYGEWNKHSAYRPADPGSTLVAKLYNAANNYDYEKSSVGLTTAKGPDGGLTGSFYYTVISLDATAKTSNTLYFDVSDPAQGANFHRTTIANLTWNQWYDVKVVVNGRTSTGYYRPTGSTNWTLIASYTQPVGFTSYSYVGISSSRFGTIDDVSWSDAGTISGTIAFSDFAGDVSSLPVKVQVIQGGVVRQTEEVRLTTNPGAYSLNVTTGTYDLAFTACQSPRSIVHNIAAPRGGTVTANATLANGDVDGDSEITSTDLSILLTNMNLIGD